MNEPQPSNAANFMNVMIGVFAELQPLRDAVSGYREAMKSDGYTDADASRMAADYHGFLFAQMIASIGVKS